MAEPIWALDACAIADAIRAKELSAKEVLETHLERIEAHNDSLLAFVHLDLDGARAQASEIDRRVAAGEEPGPLAGVPIGVKDLEDVAGLPTQYGSLLYKGHVASQDSVQVSRLRAAGCVIVGKTATPEFGSTANTSTKLHGVTRSPWDRERTPGGSSGGTSAAVSAGLIPIGTGSDGGGSIRIPASYTGLFGPKGTFGRIPRGSGPDSSYTSHFGPLARTVKDAARYYDCVVGHHEWDQFSLPHPGLSYEQAIARPPAGLRAAWSADLGYGACEDEVARIAREAADALVAAAGLVWTDRRVELKDISTAWGLFGRPAGLLQVEKWWPDRADDLTPIVRFGVERGFEQFNVEQMARATERRWQNNRILAEIFDDVDVIVMPTTSTTAWGADGPMPSQIGGRQINPMHSITFTYPFNVSGHPAVSIPAGLDAAGLPVGLQLVGRRHEDHVLFALAGALEKARPWPKLAPAFAPS